MPHNRIILSFAALLLGASALTAPAQAGWFDSGAKSDSDKPADKKAVTTPAAAPTQDLDGAIRQAQLLRTDGHYDEAIKHLSQIMLVAADDPRVVTEYGKTLAAMGRARDAVDFLTRAQQLAPNDWTVYSALGVAYDQTDDHVKASAAYEHALLLKPGEPSVLNNYALSRMMAKDSDGARRLIARAEGAGGASDPKIARNIAMINKLAPAEAVAAAAPAPQPMAMAPRPAPRVAVASSPIPEAQQSRPFVSLPPLPLSDGAPRPLVANNVIQAAPQEMMPMQQPSGVVMQRVPVDPLAGPVLPRHVAANIPNPPKAPAAKPLTVKTAAQAPAAQASNLEARSLEVKAEAIARQLANKPAAQAQAVAAAAKPAPGTPKPAETKPVVKAADAKPADTKAPVKMADAKAPVKTADAKAAPAKATPKDSVPALRVSASAY